MFEKIDELAESVVSKVSVSRRGFLGRATKAAAALGAAVAGIAAFPTEAQASRDWCWCPPGALPYCSYSDGTIRTATPACHCPKVKGLTGYPAGCIPMW